jgi:hypothetical protein
VDDTVTVVECIVDIAQWMPASESILPEVAHMDCVEVIAEDACCLRMDMAGMVILSVRVEEVVAWEIVLSETMTVTRVDVD